MDMESNQLNHRFHVLARAVSCMHTLDCFNRPNFVTGNDLSFIEQGISIGISLIFGDIFSDFQSENFELTQANVLITHATLHVWELRLCAFKWHDEHFQSIPLIPMRMFHFSISSLSLFRAAVCLFISNCREIVCVCQFMTTATVCVCAYYVQTLSISSFAVLLVRSFVHFICFVFLFLKASRTQPQTHIRCITPFVVHFIHLVQPSHTYGAESKQ